MISLLWMVVNDDTPDAAQFSNGKNTKHDFSIQNAEISFLI